MPLSVSDAIVLKTVEFSETSLILTLFTRQYGKIRAIAKGGRRLKSAFESSLDLLSHVHIAFIPKSGDSLSILTESRLLKRFCPNVNNFAGLYAAYYAVELLNDGLEDFDPEPKLFDIAAETLYSFSDGSNVQKTLIHFIWESLNSFGFSPTLSRCADCDCKIDVSSSGKIAFGLLSGGILCRNCTQKQSKIIYVSTESIASLQNGTQPSQRSLTELMSLMTRFASSMLERPPKMQRYVGLIQRFDRF